MAKGYVGWALPRAERGRLLKIFDPQYPTVVAHHCTLEFGVDDTTKLPDESQGVIVGIADDNNGVQALVLSIGGVTTRPDGGTYHITWSLNPDRKPVESNSVIEKFGWTPVSPFKPTQLIPQFFPFGKPKTG
jgi:hypothetical protein